MIVEERAASFVRSLITEEEPLLLKIAKEARMNNVPIIRPETGELLKLLLLLKKPAHILEIGTAVGYSAIYMSRYMAEDGHITTIESYGPRIEKAKENFALAGALESITLLEGDAGDILPGLTGQYDFIFLDGAKGQYIHFLDWIYRLLSDGGILVSDNVLSDGEILESHFMVPKRNRTIHGRLREYLYRLKHYQGLETAVLTVGDGLSVSVKTEIKRFGDGK